MTSHTQSGITSQKAAINPQTQQIIINHIKVNEGEYRHPYPDSTGKITIGVGFLVDDVDQFAKLPLEYLDPNTGTVRPATDAEKRQAFNDVRAKSKQVGNGHNAEFYETESDVRMPQPEIDRRITNEVQARYKTTEGLVGATAWGKLTDAQKAVLVDVEYATGDLASFNNLISAAQAGDADAMARESLFHSKDPNTGGKQRNWDRIYRNYQAASGKGKTDSANDLTEIFRRNGETVSQNSGIYRNSQVLPGGQLVSDWHTHFYSRKPVAVDATGRALPPKPAIALPESEAPLLDAGGLVINTALERIAGTVGNLARGLGTRGAISALQEGLNLTSSEKKQKNKNGVFTTPLKIDGILGPRTRHTVAAGHGKVQNALALGQLSQTLSKPETRNDPDRLTTAVAESVTPLFATTGDPQTTDRSTALIGETLQETANDLTTDQEKLKLDGQIGPRTATGVGSVLSSHGAQKFTHRFGQNLGLL